MPLFSLRRPKHVVLAASLLLLGACSNTPGVSNGSVSVCFRAIPVGRSAIHAHHASLIGVHRVPVDAVRRHLPPAAQAQLTAENDTSVCVMAFRGDFTSADVELAPPGRSGHYALLLVTSRQLKLIASVVLESLPRAFGGRTV
ncbi:MAG: hypothetical protein KGQ66_00765 [Acidobacteriota bacterium]|nr:hypothetical protein [Acidobacteriota bacterium]